MVGTYFWDILYCFLFYILCILFYVFFFIIRIWYLFSFIHHFFLFFTINIYFSISCMFFTCFFVFFVFCRLFHSSVFLPPQAAFLCLNLQHSTMAIYTLRPNIVLLDFRDVYVSPLSWSQFLHISLKSLYTIICANEKKFRQEDRGTDTL